MTKHSGIGALYHGKSSPTWRSKSTWRPFSWWREKHSEVELCRLSITVDRSLVFAGARSLVLIDPHTTTNNNNNITTTSHKCLIGLMPGECSGYIIHRKFLERSSNQFWETWFLLLVANGVHKRLKKIRKHCKLADVNIADMFRWARWTKPFRVSISYSIIEPPPTCKMPC